MSIPKILLVDDDTDDRELFCEALEALPDHVICYTAPDGRNALNQLNNQEIEKPDLIFLDINMPILNGWQCLSRLKEHEEYQKIPVIMYSTSSHPEDVSKAQELGALCFFSKQNSFNILKEGLQIVVMHLKNEMLSSLHVHPGLFIF